MTPSRKVACVNPVRHELVKGPSLCDAVCHLRQLETKRLEIRQGLAELMAFL